MPYLVVMDGPQKGRRFAIADSTTRLGRVAGNHIVLDNVSVSSGHAEITRGTDGYRLRDLDSTNGTRVNGHRVTDTLLFRDDEILFGDLPVTFCGDDAPARQDSPTSAAVSPPAPAVTSPESAVKSIEPPVKSSDPGKTTEIPATVIRPSIVVASSTSGKHFTVSMPKDFRRRHDVRLLWVAAILLLLVGIVFAGWEFYHALFVKK